MKRVLIIAYYFPPVNNILSTISQEMALNMRKFGWEPFLITTKSEGSLPVLIPEENILRIGFHCDSGKKLVSEEGARGIPKIIKIPYIISKKLGIEIASVDRFLFSWGREVLKNMDKIKKINPDVIIATCYPPTGIWLGRLISQRIKKPWVADFRDPMSLYNPSKFPFVKFIDNTIDKILTKKASSIITVGPHLATAMEKFYKKPVSVIYNGFDGDKVGILGQGLQKPGNKKIIYYAGRFHSHRLPAVRMLIDWLSEKKDNDIVLKIRSTGPLESNEKILSYAREKGITSNVQLLDPVSSDVVSKEEKEADILVIFEDLGSLGFITMPGKLTEYLPYNAPIILIARSDSDSGRVVKNASRGYVVSNSKELNDAMENILRGNAPKPDLEAIRKYSFEEQAKVLCGLLDKIK